MLDLVFDTLVFLSVVFLSESNKCLFQKIHDDLRVLFTNKLKATSEKSVTEIKQE